MNRRDLLAGSISAGLLAGAAPRWLGAAAVPRQDLPVIGLLDAVGGGLGAEAVYGLAGKGFVAGKDFRFELANPRYRADLLAMNAAEFVQRKVALILAFSTRAALAAKSITNTTPIIFLADDPVAAGLVDCPSRPGGNLTGVANPHSALIAGRIAIARELVPAMRLVVLVTDPTNKPTHDIEIRKARSKAKALGLELSIMAWTGDRSFEVELSSLPRGNAVLVFGGGVPFFVQRSYLAYMAVHYGFPAIHGCREAADEGGLISFGSRLADGCHLVGVYTARILKGEKPADLPVQKLAKTELVINRWPAKSLGLQIPCTLLARADEVIG